MRRSVVLLLACLLALATGVALLGAGAMVAMPARVEGSSVTSSRDAEANVALVRGFYDAVNSTVATGDPAALTALVAADFADHAAHLGVAPAGVGYVQQLLALRATFPAMSLAVEDVQPHGDWVLARVRVEGVARGVFFGIPMASGSASWETIELFRIAGGRIAERRAAGEWPVLPRPLGQAPLTRTPTAAFVRLGRLTFAPGAAQPRTPILGPLLVAVERGALTARVEGEAVLMRAAMAETGSPPPGDVVLGAGDALVLPMGARYALRNAGREAAVVLTLALLPWIEGTSEGGQYLWPEAGLPGVGAQLLVEGAVTDLPEGPATIALGRVTLAAQAELRAIGATGPRLAVVEAGALEFETSAGPRISLAAGQAAVVPPASAPTLRNTGDGPLVVLLVVIAPA